MLVSMNTTFCNDSFENILRVQIQ